MPAFSTLPLPAPWLANLTQLDYVEMTPIQALALPDLLAGRDVVGQAGTGTGKTCAFGLALLSRTTPRGERPSALVLCPTRELAAQVADELRRLARPLAHTRVLTLTGGTSIERERAALGHGGDVLVGTPGRVEDHLARGRLDLSAITTLVLDEADRMLEMGFLPAVTAIVAATPDTRQTLLFSATFPDAVRALGAKFQQGAVHLVAPVDDAAVRVTHLAYDLAGADRTTALLRVLAHHRPASAVIFCNHRDTCDRVAGALSAAGTPAVALHGGMDQHDRNTVLLMLRHGSLRVVVATDVAARGLDIDDLGAVVNFDLPREPDVLLHRLGRTARAGRAGLALTLVGAGDRALLGEAPVDPTGLHPAPSAPPPGAPPRLAPLRLASLPTAAAIDPPAPPPMITIAIQGGRHDRLRPGDIVGALTQDVGLAGADIGPINVEERITFVALAAAAGPAALRGLNAGRIKKQRFRAYQVVAPRPRV
jgi:ATP-independent RNA helicase DbpA